MIRNQTIFLFSTMFLTLGCQSLNILSSHPIVESPTVSGQSLKFGAGLSGQPGAEIVVSQNVGSRPPDLTRTQVVQYTNTPVSAIFGLSNHIDLKLDIPLLGGGGALNGKWQLLGDSRDKPSAGNFALAIFGSYAYFSKSRSGEQTLSGGPGGWPWTASAGFRRTSAGVSLGYQPTASLLIWGGYLQAWNEGSYWIKQDPSSDNSSQGGVYTGDLSGRQNAMGAGIGFAMGTKAWALLLAQSTTSEWARSPLSQDLQAGFALEFSF